MNRHFSKEDIQMNNKHIKRYSSLLVITEMQIKTTMNYHFKPTRMAILKTKIKDKQQRSIGEDVEKENPRTLLMGI